MAEQQAAIHEVTHPDRDEPLGWLAIDSSVAGLSFGGCRMSPSVTREEVAELAAAMTWKLGCHGSPVGGAKGGIRIDPGSEEAPRLIRHFGRVLAPLLRTSVVLGKDMGATNERMKALYEGVGDVQLALLGLPDFDWLGELKGYRNFMTGLGVSYASLSATGKANLKGLKVAIQGAGMVGLGAAYRLTELGAEVVALSDVEQCRFWQDGVDCESLLRACLENKNLKRVDTGVVLERDAIFALDVDLLILAASSYSVTTENVDGIRAPIVIEGANMAFTADARARIDQRDITVVPDVIASSSSAAMVCLQMANKGRLESEALWIAIRNGITGAIERATAISSESGMSLRNAHIQSMNSD